MKAWHYALIVFIGGCCYGVLSTFVKLGYSAGFSMAEVTGSQYICGTLLIWIATLFAKKKKLKGIQAVKMILSGIPMGLTGVFYYQSLQTLDASLAIIFLFQFVWIGTLFEWMIDKKRPTGSKMVSIAALLIGSILSAGLVSNGVNSLSWQGIVWGMLSALTFSTFIYISGSVGKDIPPIQKSALFSTGALIIVMLLFPPAFLLDFQVVVGVAPYGFFLGLLGVVLPPLLFSIGMQHVGPSLGTILAASELPVAVTMSALFLAEYVSISQWLGVVVILSGIVLGNINLSKRKLNAVDTINGNNFAN
ncbi:DMT family transporter [Bacillus sp. CGMCC 1.16607]|uniref:EamA family transporter n=1 Tax=Bacillus sp. CGMCC 1.16607 TaxID=3351842 RepID=UPI003632166B